MKKASSLKFVLQFSSQAVHVNSFLCVFLKISMQTQVQVHIILFMWVPHPLPNMNGGSFFIVSSVPCFSHIVMYQHVTSHPCRAASCFLILCLCYHLFRHPLTE